MAYGNRWSGGGGGRFAGSGRPRSGGSAAARLTGLFASRKQGLLTGTVQGENLDALIEKIKAAKKAGQGLVIFCWENDRAQGPRDPAFNLSADVSKPKEDGGRRSFSGPAARPARRRIEEPEPEPDEAEAGAPEGDDDNDPFN